MFCLLLQVVKKVIRLLPSSTADRHFVFPPVATNNMASNGNEDEQFNRAMLLLASRCTLNITLVMAQLLIIHMVSGRAMVSHICHSTQLPQCLSSQEWLQVCLHRLQDPMCLLYSKYRVHSIYEYFLLASDYSL